MSTKTITWPGIFNPNDPTLWTQGSDVDWIYGDYIHDMMHQGRLQHTAPWIVREERSAIKLIRDNDRTVLAILGALMAWRVATISQLQAGLAPDAPIPDLYRDIPGLYGAMLRMGLIDIGLSPRERLEHIQSPQVWLALGKQSRLVRNITTILKDRITGTDQWITTTLFSGRGYYTRRHARHNTFAAHTALAAIRQPETALVTGDGWGAFRRIDRHACDEANLTGLSAADVVILTRAHTTCCLEVQAAGLDTSEKLDNWMSFLAASPMSRRGLLCVWLTIPNTTGTQPNLSGHLTNAARKPTAAIGDPSVGQRIGTARWDRWFDDDGRPTDDWGTYTDLFGAARSIASGWRGSTPPDWGDPARVGDWGWDQVRAMIGREWGLDASAWRMPDHLRGGFHGFVEGGLK